jgi:hypothetical protein
MFQRVCCSRGTCARNCHPPGSAAHHRCHHGARVRCAAVMSGVHGAAADRRRDSESVRQHRQAGRQHPAPGTGRTSFEALRSSSWRNRCSLGVSTHRCGCVRPASPFARRRRRCCCCCSAPSRSRTCGPKTRCGPRDGSQPTRPRSEESATAHAARTSLASGIAAQLAPQRCCRSLHGASGTLERPLHGRCCRCWLPGCCLLCCGLWPVGQQHAVGRDSRQTAAGCGLAWSVGCGRQRPININPLVICHMCRVPTSVAKALAS